MLASRRCEGKPRARMGHSRSPAEVVMLTVPLEIWFAPRPVRAAAPFENVQVNLHRLSRLCCLRRTHDNSAIDDGDIAPLKQVIATEHAHRHHVAPVISFL